MFRQIARLTPLMLTFLAPHLAAQQPANPTLVYAMGAEPSMPIPLFTHDEEANDNVADQLFLHLVNFVPNARGVTDDMFAPSLARAWHRVDPVTLAFEIDPRARWHDGVPVTAHDVVFTWSVANNPAVATDRARLDPIASVDAIDEHTVRVRFKRAFPEQVYTFGFLMQPLPAHLLEKLDPARINQSDFAKHPIGNGPFRFDHRVAGQVTELHADTTFFLGRPTMRRVILRTAVDPAARINLFLSGESDVIDNIPFASLPQVEHHAGARRIDLPSNGLLYLLFNAHARGDTTHPHPVLGDSRVREALALALDRQTIALAAYGPGTQVPDGPESQLWNWITGGTLNGAAANPGKARQLLASAGWGDANGDGTLDRNGVPLRLTVVVVASSAPAATVALMAQQMWKKIGVDLQIDRIEPAVIGNRLGSGQWDIVFRKANQDPTPSSLVQSWSCEAAHAAGSTNYGRWCDTTFDRLVATATTARDQPAAWRAVLNRINAQHPAIFIAAPASILVMQKRFDNVTFWPSHPWVSLWQWRVRPADALARDR